MRILVSEKTRAVLTIGAAAGLIASALDGAATIVAMPGSPTPGAKNVLLPAPAIGTPPTSQTVMTGANNEPLLVLDRVGKGRVALLLSDTIWLWGKNFDGGGPQAELLRRVSHWLMKEPELEEESLTAERHS